jgi:hypothetical protein
VFALLVLGPHHLAPLCVGFDHPVFERDPHPASVVGVVDYGVVGGWGWRLGVVKE